MYFGSETGSILTSNPSAFDFGAILSWEKPQMNIFLRNNGPNSLTLDGLTLEGSGAFSLIGQPEAYPVAINEYLGGPELDLVQVQIGFSPTNPVPQTAQLIVHYNGTSMAIPLSGSGILAMEAIAQATPIKQFNFW